MRKFKFIVKHAAEIPRILYASEPIKQQYRLSNMNIVPHDQIRIFKYCQIANFNKIIGEIN